MIGFKVNWDLTFNFFPNIYARLAWVSLVCPFANLAITKAFGCEPIFSVVNPSYLLVYHVHSYINVLSKHGIQHCCKYFSYISPWQWRNRLKIYNKPYGEIIYEVTKHPWKNDSHCPTEELIQQNGTSLLENAHFQQWEVWQIAQSNTFLCNLT